MKPFDLLDLIRCPVEGVPLMHASDSLVSEVNRLIENGELRDCSDGVVQESIDSALITTNRTRLYPVRGGIPTLIPGESVMLPDALQNL